MIDHVRMEIEENIANEALHRDELEHQIEEFRTCLSPLVIARMKTVVNNHIKRKKEREI